MPAFHGRVHAAHHDRRRAAERAARRPAPLVLLGLLALACYLFAVARRRSELAPAGIVFVGSFLTELVAFVVEEVARP